MDTNHNNEALRFEGPETEWYLVALNGCSQLPYITDPFTHEGITAYADKTFINRFSSRDTLIPLLKEHERIVLAKRLFSNTKRQEKRYRLEKINDGPVCVNSYVVFHECGNEEEAVFLRDLLNEGEGALEKLLKREGEIIERFRAIAEKFFVDEKMWIVHPDYPFRIERPWENFPPEGIDECYRKFGISMKGLQMRTVHTRLPYEKRREYYDNYIFKVHILNATSEIVSFRVGYSSLKSDNEFWRRADPFRFDSEANFVWTRDGNKINSDFFLMKELFLVAPKINS